MILLLTHFNPISHCVSISACITLSHALILHANYTARAATWTAHNKPVSGGQNELINPPETERVMRHSIITRATAFAISCARSYRELL